MANSICHAIAASVPAILRIVVARACDFWSESGHGPRVILSRVSTRFCTRKTNRSARLARRARVASEFREESFAAPRTARRAAQHHAPRAHIGICSPTPCWVSVAAGSHVPGLAAQSRSARAQERAHFQRAPQTPTALRLFVRFPGANGWRRDSERRSSVVRCRRLRAAWFCAARAARSRTLARRCPTFPKQGQRSSG